MKFRIYARNISLIFAFLFVIVGIIFPISGQSFAIEKDVTNKQRVLNHNAISAFPWGTICK